MRAAPPSRMPGPIIDTETLDCENVQRDAQTSRQAQQPRKHRLFGGRLDVERKWRWSCQHGYRSESGRFDGFKLQYGDAGMGK
jgi:hypothetical protein